MTVHTIPKKEVDVGNIFLYIQEILSKNKENNKKQGKLTFLTLIDRLNAQYQRALDEWAAEADKIKEELKADYEEMKKSMSSKSIFGIIAAVVVGAVAAVALPGLGFAITAKMAFLVGVGAVGTGAVIGAGIRAAASDESFEDSFVDKEKGVDPMKVQLMTSKITEHQIAAQKKQTQASTKQGEISRKMQIDLETIQQTETAASNLIVHLLKILGRIADFQGRG